MRSRSVLTRAERIKNLVEEDRFDPDQDSPFGLPKVRVRHSQAGKKKKKEVAEETAVEGAEGTGSAATESADETKSK